jgi:hypothetical protein
MWGGMGDCYHQSTFVTAGVRPAPNLSRAGAQLAVPRLGKAAPRRKNGGLGPEWSPGCTWPNWIIAIILGLASLSPLKLR